MQVYANDPRTDRLRKWWYDKETTGEPKFVPLDLHKHPSAFAYNTGKGQEIALCLESASRYNYNELMFVALHELTHIVTPELHHTPMFWNNLKWMVHQAERAGVYRRVDYEATPRAFCNAYITENIF
eukprot:1475120-Pyramimonas_sp.AAC.1